MKILILGHGKYYRQIRSEHSISTDKDYYERLVTDDKNVVVSLDKDPAIQPDIIWDLFRYKYPFDDKEFDIIIDATGGSLTKSYQLREFWEEINRLLKLHGFFLGRRRSLFLSYNSDFNKQLSVCDNLTFSNNLKEDVFSDEIALINRYGLYEKTHVSNQHQNYLSLQKVHKPRYE